MTARQSMPSPRGAHLEMVGAVIAGDGVERIAEIASAYARAPVAVVVPRLGVSVPAWAPYERYVASRLAGGRPERPAAVAYRLERVRELSGLDPMASEDRERLGLGLKAHRIIAPRLPR